MATPTNPAHGQSFEVFWNTAQTMVSAAGSAHLGGVSVDPPGITNSNQTPISGSSTGAAQANNSTLSGTSGKTTYITGFAVTGGGATGASNITVTLTGTITGTLNFTMTIPAGATAPVTPLVVTFPVPLAASAANTAITLNVPSFGAGNTHASSSAWGFQQ